MTTDPLITVNQLVAAFDPQCRGVIESDCESVSAWMHCEPSQLRFERAEVPIEVFLPLIHDLLSSYPEFPAEERRTQKILRQLKAGAPVLPVFIEANDEHSFIMEGRHRIVAIHLQGLKMVPVIRVHKRPVA
jgi:hypothetical protein